MAWFPVGVPLNLLEAVRPAHRWSQWADGADLGRAPHCERESEYTCVLNRDFDDSTAKIRYKRGMQGRLLEEKKIGNEMKMAKVFIQGVTEGQGFSNRWVPRDYVDKGVPFKSDINDWTVRANLSQQDFIAQAWTTPNLPDTTKLGKTIGNLTTFFHDSPANFMEESIPSLIDDIGIANFTRTVLDGIKEAGLYKVLTRPSGDFNKDELIQAASFKFGPGSTVDKSGIYARFHKSNSHAPLWTPNTTYMYVGKTNSMITRYSGHENNQTSSYGDLTRNSQCRMIALCVLPPKERAGLYFLAEQILLCLFQTYRPVVYQDITNRVQRVSLHMAAKYFVAAFDKVSSLTGWSGAVRRPSFGIQQGANLSSPVLEFSVWSNRQVFVRTDSVIKDTTSGRSIPVSVFRLTRPKTTTKDHKGKTIRAFSVCSDKVTVLSAGFRINVADSSFAPIPGTPFYLVIEVYKDGTPHPHSWTRLCDIGRFKNWDQARSFALRIEWEDPPKSGKWRAKYTHAGGRRAGEIMGKAAGAEAIPGALDYYSKGISFLQWLFGAAPNHNHSWIQKWKGSARVIQAEYDWMNQTIVLKPPTEGIQMISGDAKPDSEIKAQMNNPKYGFQNVDGEFGKFTARKTVTDGARLKCDFCTMIGGNNPTLDRGACKQVTGKPRVCKNCEHLGRPCCSWTMGIKHPRTLDARAGLTPDQIRTAKIAFTALFCRPFSKSEGGSVTSAHVLRRITTSDEQEDDGSEAESEDEDEVSGGKIENLDDLDDAFEFEV